MKLFLTIAAISLGASARTFTVTNKCSFTVWPAIFSGGTGTPSQPTGWEAAPGTSESFSVPNNWSAGRIWGRQDCNFSTNPGPTSCVTGGCNGGLQCTQPGVPPATLAEFTLSAGGSDFYDVSLVDGSNIPLAITNNQGCPTASCPVNLNPSCPAQLAGPRDSSGAVVGCKSDCLATGDSAACCTGSHNTAATCPSSGVPFYSFFKGNCPDAYAYAFDESSGTALWTCSSTNEPNYTITFCP